MECPRCRRALREGTRFCTSCGLATAEIGEETGRADRRDTAEGEGGTTSDPFVGRALDSKYEIVAPLGTGGMGAVYRARRLHIGDEVAVKVLHHRFLPDESAIERFRREARSAALIGHPNVVTIHDFSEGRADGSPAYIVMELVKGASLRSLLKREGRLSEGRAVALMRDICAGVGAAHRQGVVHRDLKPDNIIVVPPAVEGDREAAKVVDFGIAKLRGATAQLGLTQTGTVLGTPYYMSPEQCRGERLDARADVYSLGAMLYEMLAGTPPFSANSLPVLISKHLSEAPPPLPPQLTVKTALAGVCMRALSKNPEERQADAAVLYRELQAALEAPAVDARPPARSSELATVRAEHFNAPAAQPRAGSFRQLKWAGAALLLLLICAAAGATMIWYRWGADAGGRANSQVSGAATNRQATASPAPQPDNVRESGAAKDAAQALAELTGSAGEGSPAPETAPDTSSASYAGRDLKGEWAGTLGPLGQPATLSIKEGEGGKFSGVLEQGVVRVAFTGSIDASTRRVTFKETRVLSGSGWSPGENTGTLSADGRTMSGTGRDAVGAQLGISYPWSFTKR